MVVGVYNHGGVSWTVLESSRLPVDCHPVGTIKKSSLQIGLKESASVQSSRGRCCQLPTDRQHIMFTPAELDVDRSVAMWDER